jgi:hypothetical protein
MKLLIFKSKTTKAVYSWNGKEVVTIVGTERRPVGKIMKGIPNDILDVAYKAKSKTFKVGDASYSILQKKLN